MQFVFLQDIQLSIQHLYSSVSESQEDLKIPGSAL